MQHFLICQNVSSHVVTGHQILTTFETSFPLPHTLIGCSLIYHGSVVSTDLDLNDTRWISNFVQYLRMFYSPTLHLSILVEVYPHPDPGGKNFKTNFQLVYVSESSSSYQTLSNLRALAAENPASEETQQESLSLSGSRDDTVSLKSREVGLLISTSPQGLCLASLVKLSPAIDRKKYILACVRPFVI